MLYIFFGLVNFELIDDLYKGKFGMVVKLNVMVSGMNEELMEYEYYLLKFEEENKIDVEVVVVIRVSGYR